MMEYYVVYHDDHDEFMEAVNKYLREGWKIQGGVSIAGTENGTEWYRVFAQALVCRKKPVVVEETP